MRKFFLTGLSVLIILSSWTVALPNTFPMSLIISDPSSPDKMPSFAVDKDGMTWIAWSRWNDGQNDIYAAYGKDSQWTSPQKVNSSRTTYNVSPKIVVDHQNVPWIFWSGLDGTDDDIYYSYWNGTSWRPEARVHPDNPVPDILPSARVGEAGTLWVTWSGFDGQIYRTYTGYWTSTGWITNRNNGQPILDDTQRTPFDKSQDRLRQGSEQAADNKQQTITTLSFLNNEGYIAFGDSITAGDGDETGRGGYPPRLDGLLDANVNPFSDVYNEGDPGETTAGGVNRIDQVLQQNRSRYILIMEGTNDVFNHFSVNTSIFNLSTMVDKSLAFGTIPVLGTIIPLRNLPGDPPTDPGNVATMTLNNAIKQLAQDKGITMVDQFQAFINYPNYQYTLFSDRHHPNAQGYDVIADTWFDGLLDTRLSGSILVLLNSDRFSTASLLLTYLLFTIDNQPLDVYVQLTTPRGVLYYLTGKNQLGPPNTPIPFRQSLPAEQYQMLLTSYPFKGTELPGTYNWTAILVPPGTDAGNTNNWINAYSVNFSFTP
jgi:lysophospholipase L1-like esterase